MSWLYTLVAVVKTPDNVPKVALNDSLINNVYNTVLALAGAVAVAYIVWGGMQYTLSQGDSGKVKKAKDTLLYAIVGLIVVMFAFVILNFVIGKF